MEGPTLKHTDITIPTVAECHFDLYMEWVCSHPEADDSFCVHGTGPTKEDAYGSMLLDGLFEKVCDDFDSEEEADAFYRLLEDASTNARKEKADQSAKSAA